MLYIIVGIRLARVSQEMAALARGVDAVRQGLAGSGDRGAQVLLGVVERRRWVRTRRKSGGGERQTIAGSGRNVTGGGSSWSWQAVLGSLVVTDGGRFGWVFRLVRGRGARESGAGCFMLQSDSFQESPTPLSYRVYSRRSSNLLLRCWPHLIIDKS